MIKCLIDRAVPSKEVIKSRQNFEAILSKVPKKYSLNSPWFYGAIGFSSVLVITILILNL
ncbi:MAG: hypothetical protein RL432_1963 [Bacteroidota bacterium]|jgi:hypothetical protein